MQTIRELRQARNWTQYELALKVGVQPQAVYLWERGQRLPQVVPMRKLGELFGLCSDEIILEPISEASTVTGHQARAHRHRGEQTPGRDPNGRVVTRGHDASTVSRDDP